MKKRILKIICFVMIFLVLQQSVSWVISPVSFSHWVNHDVKTHRSEIDTLFLGASHIYIGIDPHLFDEKAEQNTCSMNCGTTSQQLPESYYYLKDLYDYCPNIKNVFLDTYVVSFMEQKESHGTDLQRKIVMADRFMGIKNKLLYIFDEFTADELPQYLFKTTYYKQHLYEIPSNIRIKLSDTYKNFDGNCEALYEPYFYMGYVPYDKASSGNLILPENVELSKTVNEQSFKYLQRIIDFCKEKKINLYLMELPVSDDAYTKEIKYGYQIKERIHSIANQEHITLIDMNTPEIKKNILSQKDFYDSEHLTRNGSIKVTNYIASKTKDFNQ